MEEKEGLERGLPKKLGIAYKAGIKRKDYNLMTEKNQS